MRQTTKFPSENGILLHTEEQKPAPDPVKSVGSGHKFASMIPLRKEKPNDKPAAEPAVTPGRAV
jgi:hypothetical protein